MDLAPVVCSSCGTPNEAGRKFCSECGNGLGVACSVCGTLNAPSVKFCGECGSRMANAAGGADAAAAAAGPEATTEPSAERRLVSVMFADLVGFTTASEGRDAEETRELLTRYFEMARAAVERHGGTLEKFIGDAVMAVWGAPTAHEDDAERAVRAAMEITAAVPSLGDEAHPIQARAGVLTGEAAVTLGAKDQGLVAGDMVNTASRLQSAAAPGTVLVGEATYRAASNAISFEPAGELELKGKASTIQAWRAIVVVARRGGSGRAAILEPPFVGREDELRMLKDLFDATARERKSRLVSVIGQAGIGKSRLAWEFEKYLDGVVDTAWWHQGRSPAYGEGISYWALVEMVRGRAGIGEGDDEATIRSRLNAKLEEFVPDAGERRWIAPRLAGLLGIEQLPAESREELFAAWRTFFERMSEQAPVILVFTDLQWADQGMLDFVENLLSWARSAPIFVVALARPELAERRPDWGSGVRTLTRLTLEPLADAEIGEMLEGLVPGLPPAALRSIVSRAEGIPLYAVETVRMLLDRELIVPDDGRYRLTGDLASLGVAETLQALIASRLDANRPEDRALLQDASVLGQTFTLDALAAVAGEEPAALGERLDRLVQRQLLAIDLDPRSPERGQYGFVQALVREVAYASLARADRRARHLAAARHVESLSVDELAGVLASHYFAAYQASKAGAEADALAAQARVSLQAAAERAAALNSHRQARGYLEQAITVTADPAEQAILHLRATESGETTFDLDRAMDHAEAARQLYRSIGDLPGLVRATTWLGRHQTSAKVEPQAIATLEEGLRDAEPIADSPEVAALLAELSRVYMMTNRNEEAIATADRSLELSGRHALVLPVVEALVNKGTALENAGRITEAVATLRGAIAEAERHGLALSALRARNNLLGAIVVDDLKATMVLTKEGYEQSLRLGQTGFLEQFLFLLAGHSIQMGDWGAWIPEMDAVEEAEPLHPFYQVAFAEVRALLAAARGDQREADAQRARAAAAVPRLDSVLVTASEAMTDSRVALYRGEWLRSARRGLDGAQDQNFSDEGPHVAAMAAVAGGLPEELAVAITALDARQRRGRMVEAAFVAAQAGQVARSGRLDGARAGFRRALGLFHEGGDVLSEALVGLNWGLLARGHDPEAAAAEKAAEAFFTERGAAPMLADYRAAFVPLADAAPVAALAPPGAGAEVGSPATRP
ncbi:MAG: AAA family ATPase [Chloroflexi bacterium]|nr:AAA family ATPase [Chloroflexota bacterium]